MEDTKLIYVLFKKMAESVNLHTKVLTGLLQSFLSSSTSSLVNSAAGRPLKRSPPLSFLAYWRKQSRRNVFTWRSVWRSSKGYVVDSVITASLHGRGWGYPRKEQTHCSSRSDQNIWETIYTILRAITRTRAGYPILKAILWLRQIWS